MKCLGWRSNYSQLDRVLKGPKGDTGGVPVLCKSCMLPPVLAATDVVMFMPGARDFAVRACFVEKKV